MKTWVSEQFESNLFEGCTSKTDVESVINDLEVEFNKADLVEVAWAYVRERL